MASVLRKGGCCLKGSLISAFNRMSLMVLTAGGGEASGIWANVKQAIESISDGLKSIGVPVAVLALLICGLMFLINAELAQKAKDKILKIVIGCAIVFAATAIASWLESIFTFTA